MSDPQLYPCFLGPYGENDNFLEKLLVEFFRDHVYWRRNLHPEDPPAIPTHAAQAAEFQAFEARLRRELHQLSAALKRSVPFHSPRYLGHMVSDLLIPGLAAYMLALPYNPNNVSPEAAPVTIDMEVEVGLQLARMLGYPHDPQQPVCAFGHLTSGGSVANYQALRLALALKAFPLALLAAAAPEIGVPEDPWQAFNLAPSAAIELFVRWQAWLDQQPPAQRAQWRARVDAERVEQLGLVAFFCRHPEVKLPVVLAPATAHYSWSRGMKLLGLGRAQLLQVPEAGMRMDADALDAMLAQLQMRRQPVLACVGVVGSTEFGTVDPLDRIIAARQRWAERGFGFSVHADAAWGGYLASLLRQPDGSLRAAAEVAREFAQFPRPPVHAALAALAETDSVTIDPHKLGHLPYGAGAFVCRDHRPLELLAEEADYVFHGAPAADYHSRYRGLGRYIIEGSKSGAMAAAVCVTHRVLPLDHRHFGRLIASTLRSTEAFRLAVLRFAERLAGRVRVCLPFEPDSNLVCLALNPIDNRDCEHCNRFVEALYQAISSDGRSPRADREYYGCLTTVRGSALGAAGMSDLLQRLGLDAGGRSPADQRIAVLRHTLMNPFLLDEENAISYIDGYFACLERLMQPLLAAARSTADRD